MAQRAAWVGGPGCTLKACLNRQGVQARFFCFCFCRILYPFMVESYYSYMRVMISIERNSAVKEKQRVGKHW